VPRIPEVIKMPGCATHLACDLRNIILMVTDTLGNLAIVNTSQVTTFSHHMESIILKYIDL
jgi:hypothetical protein